MEPIKYIVLSNPQAAIAQHEAEIAARRKRNAAATKRDKSMKKEAEALEAEIEQLSADVLALQERMYDSFSSILRCRLRDLLYVVLHLEFALNMPWSLRQPTL
jgi:predicted RNase H-like nuclease (RuvC/YqgF family)